MNDAVPVSRPRPRIGKNVLTVVGIMFAILGLLVLALAYLVSESGIVKVPVLSGFYRGPEPVREVNAEAIDPEAFRVLVSRRLVSAAQGGSPPPYAVRLTDAELTGALRGAIDEVTGENVVDIPRAQMATTPETVEFTGTFALNGTSIDTRVRFVPVVENGGLRFEPRDVRVGDLPIHPSLAQQLASLLVSRDFGTWVLVFRDVQFSDVNLEDGAVEIFASPRS